MADVEGGGLHRTSSITKNVAKNAEFDAGVLRMGLVYRRVNFDDLSRYNLAYADGASRTGREEGSTQEVLAAVRHLGGRVAEKATLLVGGRVHV